MTAVLLIVAAGLWGLVLVLFWWEPKRPTDDCVSREWLAQFWRGRDS